MKRKVTRAERGWAAHLCVSNQCRFHRNTLLGCGKVRVIVSTVGAYYPIREDNIEWLDTIGYNRHYETYTFKAKLEGPYWEIEGSEIDSEGMLGGKADSDLKADEMHEKMVDKVTRILQETGTYKCSP